MVLIWEGNKDLMEFYGSKIRIPSPVQIKSRENVGDETRYFGTFWDYAMFFFSILDDRM